MSSLSDRKVLDEASAIFSSLTPGSVVSFKPLERNNGRYNIGERVVGVVIETPTDGVAHIRKLTADQIQRLVKGESIEKVIGAGLNGPVEDVNAKDIVGLTVGSPTYI